MDAHRRGRRCIVWQGVNWIEDGSGGGAEREEKMQMPQSLLKINNDERCRNQSGTLNSFEYTNGPQHGQPFIIQHHFQTILYCSDTTLKKCEHDRERKRKEGVEERKRK